MSITLQRYEKRSKFESNRPKNASLRGISPVFPFRTRFIRKFAERRIFRLRHLPNESPAEILRRGKIREVRKRVDAAGQIRQAKPSRPSQAERSGGYSGQSRAEQHGRLCGRHGRNGAAGAPADPGRNNTAGYAALTGGTERRVLRPIPGGTTRQAMRPSRAEQHGRLCGRHGRDESGFGAPTLSRIESVSALMIEFFT